jgi:AcrR family transcriptional regulator
MKLRIVEASERVLIEQGLEGWTVEGVAREAGCAKGLVHYHHRTKSALLVATGIRLAIRRLQRVSASLSLRGTAALDALWDAILAGVRSGEAQARLALLASREATVREPFAVTAEALDELAEKFTIAFSQPEFDMGDARALVASIEGIETLLVAGVPVLDVRDSYHRMVLYLIG